MRLLETLAPIHVTAVAATILLDNTETAESSVRMEEAVITRSAVATFETWKSVNVAIPATADTDRLPPGVPVPLVETNDTVNVASPPVVTVRVPDESRTATTGGVVHAKPTRHPLACVTNTNCVAAPCTVTTDESTVMLLGDSIVARITKSLLNSATCTFVKVATPATAFTLRVPLSVPVPAPLFEIATLCVESLPVVTTFPLLSRISTTGCVAQTVPDWHRGCVVNTTTAAAPCNV